MQRRVFLKTGFSLAFLGATPVRAREADETQIDEDDEDEPQGTSADARLRVRVTRLDPPEILHLKRRAGSEGLGGKLLHGEVRTRGDKVPGLGEWSDWMKVQEVAH